MKCHNCNRKSSRVPGRLSGARGWPDIRYFLSILNADSEQPVEIDEEALFNNPDPYGMKDYDAMEEGEDDADTAPPPLVIRQVNRPTLEIETYIDFNAPKLTERFAPDQGMPKQPVAQAVKKPAKAPTAKWTEKDAEWDAESWDV
ncbi:hypothetical protein B0H19DRAFT_1066415 [Mycena capillaripes]|nr:hypothetical protein B0H19DRAFT_1066415 [Mycena capillaripes]